MVHFLRMWLHKEIYAKYAFFLFLITMSALFCQAYLYFLPLICNPGSLRKTCLWQHFWKIIFCETFKANCPVSGCKSMFSFIWNRWQWMWQCFIKKIDVCIAVVRNWNVQLLELKGYLIVLTKAMWDKNTLAWSNHVVLACFCKSLNTIILTCVNRICTL